MYRTLLARCGPAKMVSQRKCNVPHLARGRAVHCIFNEELQTEDSARRAPQIISTQQNQNYCLSSPRYSHPARSGTLPSQSPKFAFLSLRLPAFRGRGTIVPRARNADNLRLGNGLIGAAFNISRRTNRSLMANLGKGRSFVCPEGPASGSLTSNWSPSDTQVTFRPKKRPE